MIPSHLAILEFLLLLQNQVHQGHRYCLAHLAILVVLGFLVHLEVLLNLVHLSRLENQVLQKLLNFQFVHWTLVFRLFL